MRRAVLALGGTAVGLAALFSFKAHAIEAATPAATTPAPSATSSPATTRPSAPAQRRTIVIPVAGTECGMSKLPGPPSRLSHTPAHSRTIRPARNAPPITTGRDSVSEPFSLNLVRSRPAGHRAERAGPWRLSASRTMPAGSAAARFARQHAAGPAARHGMRGAPPTRASAGTR